MQIYCNIYRPTWNFPDVIKFPVAALIPYRRKQSGAGIRSPDYNPDRAQKLIGSSMSRHLSTHYISSKSMHAFWVILQTDRQTNTGKTCTPSFVGGNERLSEIGGVPNLKTGSRDTFAQGVVDISFASICAIHLHTKPKVSTFTRSRNRRGSNI